MKKNIKVGVISFILGAIIFGGIGVFATLNLTAASVTYDNTTVELALDDLYTKATTYKNLSTATTAGANDILSGKTAYDNNGNLVEGQLTISSIDFYLFNYTGKTQFQLQESLVNVYGNLTITGKTKYTGNNCTLAIENAEGTSSNTLSEDQTYNIKELYNQGYIKLNITSDGWCWAKYQLSN